jgi:S1-C subfamily serine protease
MRARRVSSLGPGRRALLTLAVQASAGAALSWARAAASAQASELRALVARARPSVLPIGTYSATASPRFGFRGSGFVIGDGQLVVTNAHVLPTEPLAESGQRLAVLGQAAAPGREAGDLRFATLVVQDRARDLALLRLDGAPLPPLALADNERAAEGRSIVLMGFPIGGALGFATVSHRGIIASMTTVALPAANAAQLDPRAVMRLRAGNLEVLQLDATAYPGNSGGPVLDADTGEVVGIVNMVLVRGSRESALSAPTGITYAIPVRYLRVLLDEAKSAAPPR